MKTNYSFNDYQKKITFLQKIPSSIAAKLSSDEFYFPSEAVEKVRKQLEMIFGQYVMSYKGNVFRKDLPLSAHLCANYKGAVLTAKQIAILNHYEMKLQYKNVRFVVYQKPLEKISFSESPFYQ